MFAPGFAAQISKIATPKYGPLKPDVRYWHLADIKIALPNVRFGGKADINDWQSDVCF
jgi:hypothetical protein